ncbi:hypothetical protein ACGFYZ_09435 [Streptomyces sp. NPDC048330]|uniref:hypothetical protein n=1 Tax=Streptomyces sp. NPDC048330 TaxID=3365533 RepID=UPI0037232916
MDGRFAFVVRDFAGAGAACGVVLVPVGEFVAQLVKLGGDDREVVSAQAAHGGGGAPVGVLVEGFEELIDGGQDLGETGEDAVVGGGQLGQDGCCVLGGGGPPQLVGEGGDLRPEGQIVGGALVGVEFGVAGDPVADRAECGHRGGGEGFLGGLVEAGGEAVVLLVSAEDVDEAGALQDAVGLRVASVGEDFAGVRIAP